MTTKAVSATSPPSFTHAALLPGKNQRLFRDVNERIEDISEAFDGTRMLDFVCECAHNNCVERIEMTHSEYEGVRRMPTHFAVKLATRSRASRRSWTATIATWSLPSLELVARKR